MIQVNLASFKKRSLLNQKNFRNFLSRTENNPPANLDIMAEQVDKEVWAEVDCTGCANCCKVMSPTYKVKDMKRIAAHLKMSVNAFKKKWLYFDKKEKDWMNLSKPCQFLNLKTNLCQIYDVRPADCAAFPHLTKKKMPDYMHVHRQNIEYCPATYLMVEKLKRRIILGRIKIKKITVKIGE